MSRAQGTVSRRASVAEFRTELLSRLGLDDDAEDQDMRRRLPQRSRLPRAAPQGLARWAGRPARGNRRGLRAPVQPAGGLSGLCARGAPPTRPVAAPAPAAPAPAPAPAPPRAPTAPRARPAAWPPARPGGGSAPRLGVFSGVYLAGQGLGRPGDHRHPDLGRVRDARPGPGRRAHAEDRRTPRTLLCCRPRRPVLTGGRLQDGRDWESKILAMTEEPERPARPRRPSQPAGPSREDPVDQGRQAAAATTRRSTTTSGSST